MDGGDSRTTVPRTGLLTTTKLRNCKLKGNMLKKEGSGVHPEGGWPNHQTLA
jgi:hypothetical protein